jgi:hypothetical protein
MQYYRKLVNILKATYPEYNVSVRRLKLSDTLHGDCTLLHRKTNKFLIRINNALDENLAAETLTHEWAHILAWHSPGDEHNIAWGKAYSIIYRIYLAEYVEAINEE